MKLRQWLKHLGDGACEIECDQCGRPFFYDVHNLHHSGMVVCPNCPDAVCRVKDVEGMYFVRAPYGGRTNWICGKCGSEFVFHNGETEETIECPNCHNKKEK